MREKQKKLFEKLEKEVFASELRLLLRKNVLNNIKSLRSMNDSNLDLYLNNERISGDSKEGLGFFIRYPNFLSKYPLEHYIILQEFAIKNQDPLSNAIINYIDSMRDIGLGHRLLQNTKIAEKLLYRKMDESAYFGLLNGKIPLFSEKKKHYIRKRHRKIFNE